MASQRQKKYWDSMRGKSHGHKTSNGGGWKIGERGIENMKKAHNTKSDLNLTHRLQKGIIPWNKGKKTGQITWNKGLKGYNSGEKHPQWIEDRTKVKLDTERGGPLHKQWSRKVKERDGYKCKMSNDNCEGKIVAHHILLWSKFPELRYEVNNGITLCHFHHPRKRNDEMKLSPFFQELVGVKVN